MALVNWNEECSVKVLEIDEQHKKLVSILADLLEAMKELKEKDVMFQITERMIEYARYHFSTKETYMVKFAYPEYEAHKKEHDEFLAQVLNFKNGVEQGNPLITSEVLTFLWDWLKNHIQVTDKKYSACFTENGLK